ncbi:SDR family NAD(P)-dependent oxidoreductase [Streptomyces sp. NRRL S-1022]|uniref:SDR family NAD(P)-dependent oxidoreductase n=1 Tax=Streptomyces sp. NRRL S-1022 TaxID=1463880 RepID=UPI0004BF149C|nr:SDR family NAD(P)-dependent oxidoreductase [Streptomyces sp. NRRL S-1022]
MDLRLDGRLALVTGATRGIGFATARALANAGADIIGCHHSDESSAEPVLAALAETGGKHRMVRADLTDPADVGRLVEACRDTGREIGVLVNNVGIDAASPLAELSEGEWQRVLETNLTSAYRVTRAALGLLARDASVISIGSSAAARGVPGRAHYGAAKAGITGLTRALSKELGPKGVRVNSVAPGIVDVGADLGLPAEVRTRMSRMSALGRLVTADEVAHAVLFLAGDAARYVTGITLNVDGGL